MWLLRWICGGVSRRIGYEKGVLTFRLLGRLKPFPQYVHSYLAPLALGGACSGAWLNAVGGEDVPSVRATGVCSSSSAWRLLSTDVVIVPAHGAPSRTPGTAKRALGGP